MLTSAVDLNASEKQEYDNNEKNQSHATARGIAPTSTMRPSWEEA